MPVCGSGAIDWRMLLRMRIVWCGDDQFGRRIWKLKGAEVEIVYFSVLSNG